MFLYLYEAFSLFFLNILLFENSKTIWYLVTIIRYSNIIQKIQMDQIPNTNSTIRSQLFQYWIIRVICGNSDRWSNYKTTLYHPIFHKKLYCVNQSQKWGACPSFLVNSLLKPLYLNQKVWMYIGHFWHPQTMICFSHCSECAALDCCSAAGRPVKWLLPTRTGRVGWVGLRAWTK